jgi:hypothetical protein
MKLIDYIGSSFVIKVRYSMTAGKLDIRSSLAQIRTELDNINSLPQQSFVEVGHRNVGFEA